MPKSNITGMALLTSELDSYNNVVKGMLSKGEKILKKVILFRAGMIKNASTMIFLTNKQIIYWSFGIFVKKFRSIPLSDIELLSLFKLPLGGGVEIKAVLKNGKTKSLGGTGVDATEAHKFISAFEKATSKKK